MNAEGSSLMDDRDQEAIRQLLWFVADLARSRKTGALQALALELAGPSPAQGRWTRQQVKSFFGLHLRRLGE